MKEWCWDLCYSIVHTTWILSYQPREKAGLISLQAGLLLSKNVNESMNAPSENIRLMLFPDWSVLPMFSTSSVLWGGIHSLPFHLFAMKIAILTSLDICFRILYVFFLFIDYRESSNW